jgi:hypothetical protein
MNRVFKAFAAALIVCAGFVETAHTQPTALRVCGDPENLPFSNDKLEDSKTRSPRRSQQTWAQP